MSKSSVGKKPIGLHLPRITVPRDSIQIRKPESGLSSDATSIISSTSGHGDGITTYSILATVAETLPIVDSCSEDNGITPDCMIQSPTAQKVVAPASQMLSSNMKNAINCLDPSNDINIAQVISEIKTDRSFIAHGPKNSLFQQVLKAKTEENKRLSKSIKSSSEHAKRRSGFYHFVDTRCLPLSQPALRAKKKSIMAMRRISIILL